MSDAENDVPEELKEKLTEAATSLIEKITKEGAIPHMDTQAITKAIDGVIQNIVVDDRSKMVDLYMIGETGLLALDVYRQTNGDEPTQRMVKCIFQLAFLQVEMVRRMIDDAKGGVS